MMTIKKKDKVKILAGKDKGKQGEVLQVFPDAGTAIVAKINIAKRHTRPTQNEPGGIKDKELPIPLARLMLVCPKCGQSIRPRFNRLSDGKKVRICPKCAEMIL
jgi:large subunit ribosomal protein L24